MPSIEVACVGQEQPSQFGTLSFAIESESLMKSHRSPKPLFQSDFDAMTGRLYHFGNPDLRNNDGGLFFAYDLMSRAAAEADSIRFLEFSEEFRPDVRLVLETLAASSPVGRLLFTSDWQFGPAEATRFGPITLAEFWRLHDQRRLLLNSAYAIQAA
jgi:hypothetical protein